jgi:hypothetical protein
MAASSALTSYASWHCAIDGTATARSRSIRPSRRAALPHAPLELGGAQVGQFEIVRRHPAAQVRHQLQLLGSGPGPIPALEKILEKPAATTDRGPNI